jgi:predicted transcriptional regulator
MTVSRGVTSAGTKVAGASISATFPATLRAFRRRRGWTQAQLAARIGTVAGRISDYERGIRKPGKRRLAALVLLGFVPPPRQQPCVMRRAA